MPKSNSTNGINENTRQFVDWTWSNTARYVKALGSHNFDFLVGQEANAGNNRFITASMNSLLNTSLDSRYINDALGDPKTKNVSSTGWQVCPVVPLRQGGLQLCRQIRRELYAPQRRFVPTGAGPPVGNFPGIRTGMENQQRAVPVRKQDLLGCHAPIWRGSYGQPGNPFRPYRLPIRRRPGRYLLRHLGKQHQRAGRIPADVAG